MPLTKSQWLDMQSPPLGPTEVSAEGRLGSWSHLMSCGAPNSKRCLREVPHAKAWEDRGILRSV